VSRWRLGALALLVPLVAAPLAFPFFDLLLRPRAFAALTDGTLDLALNTALLVGGTLALSVPFGVAAAALLYRTDLPLRRGLRFVLLLTLFVPLPVITSAWQATLGSGGWLPLGLWRDAPGRRWASGLAPAIWIHALAALPWVVLIVGQGLRYVEGELEEDALLAAGPWRVFWRVTLPRCRGVIAAAALWVGLQTAAEIAVTDHMQVRTFAEEVYLEFWSGGADALARGTAVALPAVLLLALLVGWALPRLERSIPPLLSVLTPPRPFALGRWRWPCLGLVLAGLVLLAGVPLGSLVWRVGAYGYPPEWSGLEAGRHLAKAYRTQGETVALSLPLALLAGALTAAAALLLCWLASESRWFRRVVFALAALLWALPAPVVGIGLQEWIITLASLPCEPLAVALYERPSPLPVLWADVLRFLPCAVAVLWPVVRLVPAELRDSARVDGASPGQEFRHVVWPVTTRAALWTALVLAALALGEVGASMRVATPGWACFTYLLWDQMHYGVNQGNAVAALCLLLLGGVILAACGLVFLLSCKRLLSATFRRTRPAAARPAPRARRSAPPPP
jgi:iron(III) transport system permease protein